MMNKEIMIDKVAYAELQSKLIESNSIRIDLQEKIDKAIELIKECTSSQDEYENFISTSETKRLLKILEEVEDKEYEDIEELHLYLLDGNDSAMPTTLQDFNNQEIIKKINALIRNQKYILERLDK